MITARSHTRYTEDVRCAAYDRFVVPTFPQQARVVVSCSFPWMTVAPRSALATRK